MRFGAAALIALSASADALKTQPAFASLKNVPDQAFANVPFLKQKDQQNRRTLTEKIQRAARPTKNSPAHRGLNDANNNDDASGQYQDYWDEDMVVEQFGFDIDSYALKYTGCHVVKGWADDVAENENYDTVLGAETYVTFRLCPQDSCQGQNGYKYGCSENYGEYMLLLDEYVEALTEYREQKKQTFCEYCELCAAMKGYAAWNRMMQSSVQVIAAQVEDNYAAWYDEYVSQAKYQGEYSDDYNFVEQAKITYNKLAQQSAYGNANNNGAEYQGDNMYGAYGNYNGNGNANGNDDGNDANFQSYMNMQQAFGDLSKYWDFQYNVDKYQDNNYQQNLDWMSLNSQYPTFCGKAVLNGYFSQDGDFVEDVGYFNCYGDWVSFYAGEPFVWDECCMGEIPYSWDLVQGNDPDSFQSCDSQYSTACASAFRECEFTLHYDDTEAKYQSLLQQAGGYDSSIASQLEEFENTYAKQEAERRYTESLTCQAVQDYQPDNDYDWGMEQNTYNNQQNYEQLYQQKKQYQQAAEQCGGDADCESQVEESMYMNQEYQLWIIQSAWEEYSKYKVLNQQFYVGAYCADDFNIGLKVFTDEKCSVEHPSVDVEDVMGDNLQISYDLTSGECIPCNDDQFTLDMQQANNNGNSNNDDGDNVDGVLPFCSMLYQLAAKCNHNLSPDKVYNAPGFYQDGMYFAPSFSLMYGSEQQEDNEKKICAMVESLNSGTYKGDGSIYLGGLGWISPQHWRNEFSSASSGMPRPMKTLIFILVICAAAMGLWAMVLHGALARKSELWQPQDRVDLERQNSGIVMGRSRSGLANAPLI